MKKILLLFALLSTLTASADPYVIKLIQEGEDIYNISEYTDDKCNLTTISIDDARVSNGRCVRIAPNKTNGTYDVTYNIEGLLPGVYKVHVVTLPKTMVNETATDLPVKYKIKLKSSNQDGQEIETDCGAYASVANEITDNVAENIEITGNYAKIILSGNASAKKAKTETSEMYLDCIYLEREINIPEVTFPDIAVSETNFPDEKFRNWILMQSYGSDGVLTPEEVAAVTSINVNGKRIQNLKGIDIFKVLEYLDCSNNQLTSLDVSENSTLKELYCYQNQIKGIGMDALVESLPTVTNGGMYVIYKQNDENKMTTTQVAAAKAKGWIPYIYSKMWNEYNGYDSSSLEINATNFPDDSFRNWLLQQNYGYDGFLTSEEILNIKQIVIHGQQIQNLKGIEYFKALEELNCSNNQLTSLDVSNNTALTTLYCSNNQLTTLDLSKNTELEYFACADNQLTSVTLGNGLKSINDSAFKNFSALTSIAIPNSVISIGNSAFQGCSGLTSVTFGNGLESIGQSAFNGCSGLTSVTIPNSVKSIGGEAFRDCSNLTSVTFGNGLESIGQSAFNGCSGLTSVTIPNSVISIDNSAFQGCSGLTSVTFGKGLESIGQSAFNGCSGLTSVNIPNSVTSIGYHAFSGCSGLTSVTIPNSVISIENFAFYGCSGLTSVTIPNSVISIDNSAFQGCSGLTSVTFGKGLESIGQSAFNGCSDLTSVTIPNSVTSIGSSAFQGCSSLTSIEIPNSVTSIGIAPFFGCSNLTSISVKIGNTQYDSRDNCNAIIETATNTLVTGCKNTIIPNSVTSIGGAAFSGCSGLTSVNIPNSVTSIGYHAFSGCSGLTSVTIPNSVISIENFAFYGCSGLTSVTIPNSVTSIGENAFRECSGLTSAAIGNSVTEILDETFYGCSNLTSVKIGNSVTLIWSRAFLGCSSLSTISLGRGIIAIGGAFSGCSNLQEVYCYATDVPITVKSSFRDANLANATLYVLKDLMETYKATAPWSEFGNILELEDIDPDPDPDPDPTPTPEYVHGDVNGDGLVNGTDIQAVINLIVENLYDEKGDVNKDGNVNGTDIQEIINYIVNGPNEDTSDDDGNDEDELYEDEKYSSTCLPAIMEEDPTISIFCQALELTNMAGYMKKYIDYTYSVSSDSVTNGVPGKRFGGKDMVAHYNEKRYFKYTAFVETNEVLKKYGINSLEDLIARAKTVYDATFPKDAGLYDDDYTNRKNPLNRWVSYHLMNRYGEYSDWAPYGQILTECCRTDVADAEDFWQTMLNEGMIRFCRASGQLYANRKGLKNAVSQGLKGVRVLTDSESGSENMQAINGRYFYLDDILEYNTDVRDKVLNCRMRIDATTLSADFMNQGSRGNLGWDENYLFAHKRGYIEGWKISPETFVGVHCDNLWWSSYLGNAVAVKGQYDVQIKLPNPPPGLYEIRLAYVAGAERGVVQVYFNNESCGIADLRKSVWWEFIDRSDYDLNNEEDNVALDRDLRKLGYMLGPDSYGKPGYVSFRVNAPEHLRKIIATVEFKEGKNNWLRLRQVLEGDAEWSFDYIELCPVSIINEEDRH